MMSGFLFQTASRVRGKKGYFELAATMPQAMS
jgi:hypothetical protein